MNDYVYYCCTKVGRVFPLVVVSLLSNAEFRPNDHREDAPHFRTVKFFDFLNVNKHYWAHSMYFLIYLNRFWTALIPSKIFLPSKTVSFQFLVQFFFMRIRPRSTKILKMFKSSRLGMFHNVCVIFMSFFFITNGVFRLKWPLRNGSNIRLW